MARHIFFDLDDTLTPSRAAMLPAHVPLFERLCATHDVIVVTGGSEAQMRKQIPCDHRGHYYMLSQQGNYAVDKDGSVLWQETVSHAQEEAVRKFARVLAEEFTTAEGLTIPDENDIFENRGSQLASSVFGFHADNNLKYRIDPDQSKRRALLAAHPHEIAELKSLGIEAMPAGTTTIDFILAGKHKGYNITRLLALKGWKKEDCLYMGDALFPGGNDESAVGVIPTHAVKDPADTFEYIKTNLS